MDNKTEMRKCIRLDIAKEEERRLSAIRNRNNSEKIRAEVSIYRLKIKLSKLFK